MAANSFQDKRPRLDLQMHYDARVWNGSVHHCPGT